jgi:phosphopantetheinyl transferase
MPLIKIQKYNNESAWGLWFISETEETLKKLIPEDIDNSIQYPAKRLEWMAGRSLLLELVKSFNLEYKGIYKDEAGKPFLNNLPHHISLTHSYPYVAAQIDTSHNVGIDLEQPKQKLLRIAPRILSEFELNDAGENIIKNCVYWCAKEAMYKYNGRKGIHFSTQLLIEPFELQNHGELKGTLKINGINHQIGLNYLLENEYVLVHTISK